MERLFLIENPVRIYNSSRIMYRVDI